eukprot:2401904-Pyramimonas_sp.AAC.2
MQLHRTNGVTRTNNVSERLPERVTCYGVDVRGYGVDDRGCVVDVRGCVVDGRGYCVDGRGSGVDVRGYGVDAVGLWCWLVLSAYLLVVQQIPAEVEICEGLCALERLCEGPAVRELHPEEGAVVVHAHVHHPVGERQRGKAAV